MYIVYFKRNKKHSAWQTAQEAKHQAYVLSEYGYQGVYTDYIQGASYSNGQYFV